FIDIYFFKKAPKSYFEPFSGLFTQPGPETDVNGGCRLGSLATWKRLFPMEPLIVVNDQTGTA
ncbi:MAG: hypothetical protein O7C63_06085, partial [Alphaproteobacteria bacterium]|nr:hypothetical protein [Alphaproteobacteria bacterium]